MIVAVLGGIGAANAGPQISVSPPTVYITAIVDSEDYASYRISNTGDAPLVISDQLIFGDEDWAFRFSDVLCSGGLDCPTSVTVPPGGNQDITISCQPAGTGHWTAASVVFTSNATNSASVALDCTAVLSGPMSSLTWSPSTLSFPVQYAEPIPPTSSIDRTVTITNNAPAGSAPAVFTIETPPANFGYSFSLPGDGLAFVPPGASQDVVVRLSWSAAFVSTDPLVLRCNDPALGTVNVPMFAEAAYGDLVFDDLPDFYPILVMPTVPVGGTSTFTIRAHNGGDYDLDVVSAWAGLTQGGTSDLEPYVSYLTLAPGQAFQWTFTCTPTDPGGALGEINFDLYYSTLDTRTIRVECPVYSANLATNPTQIQFGDIPIGTTQTVPVHVVNTGTGTTDLVAISGGDAAIVATPRNALPITLAAGAEAIVDVSFTPASSADENITLTFDAASGVDPIVTVSGRGYLAAADITPTSYDFGVVSMGALPSHEFELHNGGTKTVTITSVAFDAPADFSSTLSAGTTIAPGDIASFDVTVTPSMLGRRHATLTIASDIVPPFTVPLDVLAIDPELHVTTVDATPDDYDLDVGTVDVDVGARMAHVTLHNSRSTAVTIETCGLSGDAAFGLATMCPFTIAPGGDADVVVGFDPDAEAAYKTMLTLTGADITTGSLAVAVHGVGIDQHVELSTMTLAFPDTFRHPTTPATLAVTVHNVGVQALDLTTLAVTGDGFSLVGPATATLAPGATQDITVAFSPPSIGAFSGQLALGNADDPAIARVALTGTGIARDVTVMPMSVDFGVSYVGETEKLGDLLPGAITIANVDATAPFTITSITLTGDGSFQPLLVTPAPVPPGGRATLDVALTPQSVGVLTATIDVYLDGDPASQARITLTTTAVKRHGHGCSGTTPTGFVPIGVIVLLQRRRRTPR